MKRFPVNFVVSTTLVMAAFVALAVAFGGDTGPNSPHRFDRVSAVSELTDQTLLAKIATQNRHEGVRLAAVDKLTDQATLARIAAEDENQRVGWNALVTLHAPEQEILAQIATEARVAIVRYTAVLKLTDHTMLAKIAKEAEDTRARGTAVSKLANQTVLAKIAI